MPVNQACNSPAEAQRRVPLHKGNGEANVNLSEFSAPKKDASLYYTPIFTSERTDLLF